MKQTGITWENKSTHRRRSAAKMAAVWFGLDQGTYVGKTGFSNPAAAGLTQHSIHSVNCTHTSCTRKISFETPQSWLENATQIFTSVKLKFTSLMPDDFRETLRCTLSTIPRTILVAFNIWMENFELTKYKLAILAHFHNSNLSYDKVFLCLLYKNKGCDYVRK